MYHLAFQPQRRAPQTDGQTDNIIMPIGDQTACSSLQLANN